MYPCHLPYAVDLNGQPIFPIAAKRFKRSSLQQGYMCPECKAPVQRYAETGGKQPPHFRHLSISVLKPACCFGYGGGESAFHRRACHDVKATLLASYAAADDDPGVSIEATCPIHGPTRTVRWNPSSRDIRIDQTLPKSAILGETDPLYRPDIVVYRNDGRVDLIIEIRHRHEISPEKVDYYARRGFEWIEVMAKDINTMSRRLVARQHSFAMPCCADADKHFAGANRTRRAESLTQLAPFSVGTNAIGHTPWNSTLVWNGRRWRELGQRPAFLMPK